MESSRVRRYSRMMGFLVSVMSSFLTLPTFMKEAVATGRLAGLEDCEVVRREVAVPDERGRFDLLLTRGDQPVANHQLPDVFAVGT